MRLQRCGAAMGPSQVAPCTAQRPVSLAASGQGSASPGVSPHSPAPCRLPVLQLYSPPGSSCGTVSPDSREECCQTKANDGTEDEWCAENYPEVRAGGEGARARQQEKGKTDGCM